MTASIWAAIAATFSAISAGLMVYIHRQNLLLANRPELILLSWTREKVGNPNPIDRVKFSEIRNIGRGAAINAVVEGATSARDKPITFCISLATTKVLAPGDCEQMEGDVVLYWKNVPPREHDMAKLLAINVTLYCWDTTGMRYTTTYHLLVFEPDSHVVNTQRLTSGVYLTGRRVTIDSVAYMQVKSKWMKAWKWLKTHTPQRMQEFLASEKTSADSPILEYVSRLISDERTTAD